MSTPSPSRKKVPSASSNNRTRRLRVWLNHSVLAPASPATFHEQHHPDNDINDQHHQVSNIDQALETNYKLTDLEVEDEAEDFTSRRSSLINDDDDDHVERTKELLQQLSQSPLDFLQDEKLLEEEWKWKFGSTGKQEFQFASFEMNDEDGGCLIPDANASEDQVDSQQQEQQAELFKTDRDVGTTAALKAHHDDAFCIPGVYREDFKSTKITERTNTSDDAESSTQDNFDGFGGFGGFGDFREGNADYICDLSGAKHPPQIDKMPAIAARINRQDLSEDGSNRHVIDIPPTHHLRMDTTDDDEHFGDFQQASSGPLHSAAAATTSTPKSNDGVSTLLNNFQLDFQDFPTPNTLHSPVVEEEGGPDETINPQEPDDGLIMPASIAGSTTSPPRNNILTPRNFRNSCGSLQPRKVVTSEEEPMTPIIHNQSAKKRENFEPSSRQLQQATPLSQPSLSHPEASIEHGGTDRSSPNHMFTNISPHSLLVGEGGEEEDSSIPSVVRIISKATEAATPPTGTVLFPTFEQDAFFNSPQSMQTPEGRFLRRQYSSKLDLQEVPETDDSDDSDGDASLSSLHQFYYEENGNGDQHILQLLQKLEWDWVPYWQWDSLFFPIAPTNTISDDHTGRKARFSDDDDEDEEEGLEDWMVASRKKPTRHAKSSRSTSSLPTEDSIPLFHEELVQQLSHLDSSHVKISKILHKRIQPHSGRIEESNRLALELGKNLQLCEMYLHRSMESASLARNGTKPGEGADGALELVQSWQVHSAYTQLEDLLEKIQWVKDMEESIIDEIESYDPCQEDSCGLILKMQLELNSRLRQDPLAKLDCLRAIRERCSSGLLKKFQVRLHSCLESVAVRCCSAHDSPLLEQEYNSLVQAIVQISGAIHASTNYKRTALEICTSLQTAWLLQTQRSFGLALLDPTDDPGDSAFDKELMALTSLYDINVGSGLWFMDPSKLEVWKQNLVTIRLDFEIQLHPLPAVLHKLCVILFQVLHGHYALWHWHSSTGDKLFEALKQELSRRRPSIWNACIQVLEECFEEYLKYVGKKKLFDADGNDDDWLLDLQGLEDVAGLIRQFLSLQSEFLKEIEITRSINDGGMVEKKLHSILQKHVRAFHIQAMNKMGLSLYREDWVLHPIGKGDCQLLETLLLLLQDDRMDPDTPYSRSRSNLFEMETEAHFANFVKNGNPFHIAAKQMRENGTPPENYSATTHADAPGVAEVFRLLSVYCDGPGSLKLVPNCFRKHAIKWIARLLTIMKKLPSATGDAMVVLQNIFNLYITTAFRVCAGSSAHEQILLGISSPRIPEYVLDPASPRSSSQNLFGFGRRSSNSSGTPRAAPVVAPIVDAELCAPLSCEMETLRIVQNLIVNAQNGLDGFVKLDLVEGWITDPVREPGEARLAIVCRRARVLETRHAVAWSCVFMAATLHAASIQIHAASKDTALLHDLDEYVESIMHAVPVILSMSSRISCIRAISGKAIVQEIINLGNVWEEAKLHEHANEYIESICDICSLLWCSLSNAKTLPSGALHLIWENVLGGCYLALLDGFSRIPFCSTEGRALMSMDLASLNMGMQPHSVLDRLEDKAETKPPPKVSVPRGMAYVDTYIKIFYFPPLDAYNWIEENYAKYQRAHTVALIAGAVFASGDRHVSAAKKVIQKVKALYEVGGNAKVASV